MNWIPWISGRFLGRRGSVLKAASLISACGIAFAVAATLVTLAVVSGFEREYERAILGFNAHIILIGDEETRDTDVAKEVLKNASSLGVVNYSPYAYREGLAVIPDDLHQIVLKGVDRDASTGLYPIRFYPPEDPSQAATPTELLNRPADLPRVIIGRELLETFYPEGVPAHPTIRVLVPKRSENEKSTLKDYMQVFSVAGVFESGLHEFDAKFALMALDEMDKLFEMESRVTGLEILLDDPYRAPETARALERDLGNSFQAVSWDELNEPLFEAMKMEKILFIVIMLLVTLVAAVNVMGVVLMLILNRRDEAAILIAMGARERDLRRVFTLQGLIVGTGGVLVGSLLAGMLLWSLEKFQWFALDPEIYFIRTLPVTYPWELWTVILIAVFGMITGVSMLATRFLARDHIVGAFR